MPDRGVGVAGPENGGLKVSGPLPGRPAERGEFVMEVSFYGDPPGWWITVEA